MQYKNLDRLKWKSGIQQKILPNSWIVTCVDRSPKLTEVWSTCNWFYIRTLLGKGRGFEGRKTGKYVFLVLLRDLLNLTSAFLLWSLAKPKKTPNPNLVTLATASMAFLKQERRGICPQEKKLPLKQKIWWTCPGPSCPGNWDQCPLHMAIWNIPQAWEWSLPSAFCLDFKISKYFAIRGYLKRNDKHQRPSACQNPNMLRTLGGRCEV